MNSSLALELFEIGCVKFGSFTLKSGMVSPIYVDLRILVSHPKVLKEVAGELVMLLSELHFDRIAGIPYAALPIATAVSLQAGIPMIYTRKEQKEYGTKKLIEGEYKAGETIAVIDDLVTTAKSKFEAISPLEEAGLKVKDIVVLIDREQGGKQQLQEKGYALHSALKLSEMLSIYRSTGKISEEKFKEVQAFLERNKA